MKTNSITIVGHVGLKPETKELSNDKQVTKFLVAHSNPRTNITEWFTVDCWNQELGESILKSVTKGSRVKVTGSLRVNRYEKKDGSRDFRLVIMLDEYQLLSDQEEEQPDKSKVA